MDVPGDRVHEVEEGAGRPAVGETVMFSNDACGLLPNGNFNMTTVTTFHGDVTIAPETQAKIDLILAKMVARYESPTDTRPWIVAYSGGKDSTLVVHLLFEALRRVRPSRRTWPNAWTVKRSSSCCGWPPRFPVAAIITH